jgi:hypothetical protein
MPISDATTSLPTRHFRARIHSGVQPSLIADCSVVNARQRAEYLAKEQNGQLTEFYEVFPEQAVANPYFTNQVEIFLHLGALGDVQCKDGYRYRFIDGALRVLDGPQGAWIGCTQTFTFAYNFKKYPTESAENWHEALTRQAVMCWVSDSYKLPSMRNHEAIELIHSSEQNDNGAWCFCTSAAGHWWDYATPLTQDEMAAITYRPIAS